MFSGGEETSSSFIAADGVASGVVAGEVWVLGSVTSAGASVAKGVGSSAEVVGLRSKDLTHSINLFMGVMVEFYPYYNEESVRAV